MRLTTVVNKPANQPARHLNVFVQDTEILDNTPAWIIHNFGGVNEGDVQKVMQRMPNSRDRVWYVGTVNRASVPRIRSGHATLDEHSRQSLLGAADTLRVIEETMKPSDAYSFVVAFQNCVEANIESGTFLFEYPVVLVSLITHYHHTQAELKKHPLHEEAGDIGSFFRLASLTDDKLQHVARNLEQVTVTISTDNVPWGPDVDADNRKRRRDGPGENKPSPVATKRALGNTACTQLHPSNDAPPHAGPEKPATKNKQSLCLNHVCPCARAVVCLKKKPCGGPQEQ